MQKRFLGAVVICSFVAAGCPAPNIHNPDLDSANPRPSTAPKPPVITAPAGLMVPPGPANKVSKLSGMLASRSNPFALMPSEANYERAQLAANLVTMGLTFPMFYKAPDETVVEPTEEQQPYRRLAGILIGDSVTALIDMGDGQLTEIHPGMRIPNTDWQVVSIDSEKAVLRRVGSNTLPNELIIRLESAPANGAPNNNNNNNPPGFPPGVPPGGGPPGAPQGAGN